MDKNRIALKVYTFLDENSVLFCVGVNVYR